MKGVKMHGGLVVCMTFYDLRGTAHLADPVLEFGTTVCGMRLDSAGDRPNGKSCITCAEGAFDANHRLRKSLDCPVSGQTVSA